MCGACERSNGTRQLDQLLHEWQKDENEDDVQKTMRVAARRSGKHDYQIVEEALRAYLGLELLERVGTRSALGETGALETAYEESHQLQNGRSLILAFARRRLAPDPGDDYLVVLALTSLVQTLASPDAPAS